MLKNEHINENDNRVLTVEDPTSVILDINGEEIEAVLNNSTASKALLEKLPLEITLGRGSSDYCGIFEELPFNDDERQDGWFKGDISFDPNGNWFVIFFGGDNNRPGATEVTLGQLADTAALDKVKSFGPEITVKITLKEKV